MKNSTIFFKIFFLILIAVSAVRCGESQLTSEARIKYTTSAGYSYWITVADRNCGANNNSSTSYGDYYMYNEASSACSSFIGSDNSGNWRLPTKAELKAISDNLVIDAFDMKLYNQSDDTTKYIYFPYAGRKATYLDATVIDINSSGNYWSSDAMSDRAWAMDCYTDGESKMSEHNISSGLSVRCVKGDAPNITPKAIKGIDGKYGFVDKLGEWFIKPQYDSIDIFIDGLAKVKLNDKWGFIDEVGEVIIELNYDHIDSFSDGIAKVILNDKFLFIDKSGKVIDPQIDFVRSFSDGLAAVEIGDKWGFVDEAGEIVIDPKYDWVSDFSEGYAGTILGGQFGTVNKSGEYEFIPADQEHNYAYAHSGEISPFYYKGKSGFSNGNVVIIAPKYEKVATFHAAGSGLAGVKLNDKWGYIDVTEAIIIEFQYDDANSFFDGLAAVKSGDKWGFIDTTGNVIIDFQYEDISADRDIDYYGGRGFQNGLAGVKLNGKWGLINVKGEYIAEPQYDLIGNFNDGLAGAQLNEKYGFIDETGKVVIEFQYDDIAMDPSDGRVGFQDGLAGVKLNDKWGYIDETGKIIIKFQFDKAYSFSLFEEDFAEVTLNGEEGSIDKSGKFHEGKMTEYELH